MGCTFEGREYSEKELNEYLLNNYDKYVKIINENIDGILYSLNSSRDNILELNNESKDKSGTAAGRYIEQPHILYKSDLELLVPEFRLEEYKKKTLDSWYNERISSKDESLTTEEFKEVLSQEFDEMIKTDELFSEFSEKVIHALLYAKINNNINQYNGILSSLDSYQEILGENFNVKTLDNTVNNIYKKLKNTFKGGMLLSEISLQGIDKFEEEIKGRVDIIGIDSEGNLSIFDLKLSSKPFEQWDSVKLQKLEYQLGIYRQLLAHNGININKMGIFSIPLSMTIGQGNTLTTNPDIINIGLNKNMDLIKGKVSQNLRLLIPDKFKDSFIQTTEIDKLIETRLGQAFGKFGFQTQIFNENADSIYEKASKTKTEHNKYYFRDEILDKYVYVSSLDELKKEIDNYMERLKDPLTKNAKLIQFVQSLKQHINNKTIPNNLFNLQNNPSLNNDVIFNFKKYTDGTWEIIDSDVLLNSGIVGFKSNTGILEFVTLTVNKLDNVVLNGKNYTLLGQFLDNETYSESSIKNIELMKILIVLNEIPELFKNGEKLGNINVFNYLTGKSDSNSLDFIIKDFNKFSSLLGIENNFLNGNIDILDRSDYIKESLKLLYESFDNEKDQKLISFTDSPEFQLRKVEKLVELLTLFIRIHPEYGNLNFTDTFTVKSKEDELFYILVKMLNEAKGKRISGDIINTPEIGSTFAEFGNVLKAFFSYNDTKVNADGIPTIGLFGGYDLNNPDVLNSADMKIITELIKEGHDALRRAFNTKATVITNHTIEYYKEIGFANLERKIIGDSYKHHQNFYRKNTDGTLDSRFLFKNPYDSKEVLSDAERKYLKKMLWEINKQTISKLTKEELNETDLDKIMNFPSVINHGDKYFEVPLIPGNFLSKSHNTTINQIKNQFQNQLTNASQIFDQRGIVQEQLLDLEEQKNNYHTMINAIRMSSTRRSEILEKYGPQYFETNLDAITLTTTFNYIRETEMNKILPIIHSIATELKVLATFKKVDIKDQLEYLYKRLKADVFGEQLIHKETRDALKVIATAKSVSSAINIALRPVQTLKEGIVGTVTNFSKAYLGIFGAGTSSFSTEDLMNAYKLIIGKDSRFPNPVDFMIGLNNKIGLVDRDINSIVSRQQVDRSGILGGTSRFMYSTAIAADHLNRTVLYVAQMMAEGSIDSIEINELGEMIYDFKKDKRFSEFIKHKDNPNYTSEEFRKQKSLYRIRLDEFSKSGYTNKDGSPLKSGDDLPEIHTPKEINSLKSAINTTYGYYNEEDKAMFQKLWGGILFMNFRNYWTAKKNLWFIKRTNKTDKGGWATRMVDNNGKLEKLYRKEILDEKGNVIDIKAIPESSPENDGTLEEILEWQGDVIEGLYWSLAYTFRDVIRGHGKDAFSDKQRVQRAKLALHDILRGSLGVWLSIIMFKFLAELLGFDLTDDEVSISEHALVMGNKAIVKANKEFDPFSNIFAFNFEPTFTSVFDKSFTSAQKVFFGDGDGFKELQKNVKLLELIPN